ncbi:MAG TPA: hypothetical protein DCG54_07465 [Anaerolineae bacterium]|jgi:hypothetical protein|nr:hypothetical protein [Anaerolineae bacterium]
MADDLELEDKDGNSIYVDTTYAEELIVDLNGEVVSLNIEQAEKLRDAVGAWIAFVAACSEVSDVA